MTPFNHSPLKFYAKISLLLLLSGVTGLHGLQAQAVKCIDLRCEYTVAPIGIDEAQPQLSWRMESDQRGELQTAYHILVASSEALLANGEGDLWDTGKVETDQSQHIIYAGEPLSSNTKYHWKVRLWDKTGEASEWSDAAAWTMGLMSPDDWVGEWIGAPEKTPSRKPEEKGQAVTVPSWQFRTSFDLASAPESALFTIQSPAYYEVYVNGQKVGEDVLNPAVSALKKRSFSVSYDVRDLLKPGENIIGVWSGHWAQPCKFRAQLNAVVTGKPVVITSNPSWLTRKSAYSFYSKGRFGGEKIDARERLPEWASPLQDTSSWVNAKAEAGMKGIVMNQPAPLNRIGKTITATGVRPIEGGKFEIDFGTNLTGWLRLKLPQLPAGHEVTLTFADVLRTEGRRPGYQTFGQISQFVASGNAGDVFEHKFNYAGFRYVVVAGLESAPAPEDATAMLIETDLESAGAFECSNDLLNRIFYLNEWTMRAINLGAYSVDCPHRERRGYGGDGQTPIEGFLTSFRGDGFYRKWLMDWQDVQRGDGSLPNTAPQASGGGGPAWGGFVAAAAWRHYLYYGDKRILEENYDVIRKYVEHMESVSAKNGDILNGKVGRFSFIGDWVAPGRGMDTKNMPSHEAREVFNNCYRIYHMQLHMKIAAVLGKDDEVAKYQKVIERIRPLLHEKFYDPETGTYVYDQQAYYILPLMTGVVPADLRNQVLKSLERNILETREGHLDTGLLGTYFMLEYLREIGRNDLLFTMFNKTTYPSWGYMLEQGGTTVWEQWNGYASHIHSCFPSANNWLYQGLAGIQADPAGVGFKQFTIQPEIVGDVTWVKSHYDSQYGRIISNWKREDNQVVMEVSVPPNTSATVVLPVGSDNSSITINGKDIKSADGITLEKSQQERLEVRLVAGHYKIQSVLN